MTRGLPPTAAPISAILFDLFGTLVVGSPTGSDLSYSETHRLLRAHGAALTYDDFLRSWASVTARLDRWSAETHQEYSIERVCSELLRTLDLPCTSHLVSALTRSHLRERFSRLRAVDGTPALLAELAERFRLGLVTNTHDAGVVHDVLDRFGLREHFTAVITSVEHGRRKPHHSIFEHALAKLEFAPHQAVFVGDSYGADYLGALQSGLYAILVDPADSHGLSARQRICSIPELRAHPLLATA